MRKAFCLFVFSFIYSISFAQNVAVVNGKPISTKEFTWAYKKSHNGNISISYDTLKAYLNLYINFKLKVLDAREMGLDKTPGYQEEIKNYEEALTTHKKPGTSSKDHDFLLNEYREGVLMFNVSEQKIWNKAQEDEQAINEFYSKNKQNYNKPLSEVRGDVIADYQQSLEEKWLNGLKQKYQTKINESELKKLAKL
ncbi:putative peptidyl-prolyl cis-trans isomerase Cbf2 precursor [compost metagenome]